MTFKRFLNIGLFYNYNTATSFLLLSSPLQYVEYVAGVAGVVGTVGKISALRPQGPQFDFRLCQDLNIYVTSFPPKLNQLSILPGYVNEYQHLLGANL